MILVFLASRACSEPAADLEPGSAADLAQLCTLAAGLDSAVCCDVLCSKPSVSDGYNQHQNEHSACAEAASIHSRSGAAVHAGCWAGQRSLLRCAMQCALTAICHSACTLPVNSSLYHAWHTCAVCLLGMHSAAVHSAMMLLSALCMRASSTFVDTCCSCTSTG